MASIFPSSRANLPHYWGNILLSTVQDTWILWVFSSLWQVRRTISIPLWALGLLHPLLFGVSFLGLRYILHTYELIRMEQGTPRNPVQISIALTPVLSLCSPIHQCSSPFSCSVFQEFYLFWPLWMLCSVSSDLGEWWFLAEFLLPALILGKLL